MSQPLDPRDLDPTPAELDRLERAWSATASAAIRAATEPTDAEVERLIAKGVQRRPTRSPSWLPVIGLLTVAAGLLLVLFRPAEPVQVLAVGERASVRAAVAVVPGWSVDGSAEVALLQAWLERPVIEILGGERVVQDEVEELVVAADGADVRIARPPDHVRVDVQAGRVEARRDGGTVAPETATPGISAASRAFAALLARREAGDSPPALLDDVDAFLGEHAGTPMGEEAAWLRLELLPEALPARNAWEELHDWAERHPGHPRYLAVRYLEGSLAVRRLGECSRGLGALLEVRDRGDAALRARAEAVIAEGCRTDGSAAPKLAPG